MSKNHDENKDIRLLSRICKIDYSTNTIQAPKSAVIGIRSWGRIDYLCNYCGWHFFWNNDVTVRPQQIEADNVNKRKREIKKAAKEQTLTNKKRK